MESGRSGQLVLQSAFRATDREHQHHDPHTAGKAGQPKAQRSDPIHIPNGEAVRESRGDVRVRRVLLRSRFAWHVLTPSVQNH